MSVTLLGLDPGFANVGVFAADLLGMGAMRALRADLIVTRPEAKKRKLREDADDDRRLEEIQRAWETILDEVRPDVVASERCPRLRNPKANRQCAAAYGVLRACVRARGVPFIVFDADEIKRRTTGNPQASKDQMVKELKRRFPRFKGWPDSKRVEHVADAGGATLCAQTDSLVELLLRERAQ